MRRCHEVDYEVVGSDMQMVIVELDHGETVIAEAGAMNFMQGDVSFEAKMGDGSDPDRGIFGKLFDAGVRKFTGESVFLTHFTQQGAGRGHVAFAAPFPGRIVDLDMQAIGGELLCQKDCFLCAALGTKVGIAFNKRIGSGLFGGEGFILQRLQGDGMVFVHAGGTVIERVLDDEVLMVDTGCLVAFTPGVEYEIQTAGGLKSMFLGGEGMFLARLSGSGRVWLQSLPFSRLADRILQFAPAAGGAAQGEQ